MPYTKIDGWSDISNELMCEVVEIRYGVAERIGIAILKDGHCTDMCGAIRFFQRIDPEVRQVQTFGGKKPDMVYSRIGDAHWHRGIVGKWVAGHQQ